jgi:predicted  nucleic acid-binding Zn-ribbon protein
MPVKATVGSPAYYKELAGALTDWGRNAKALIPTLLEYGEYDEKKSKLDAELAALKAEIEAAREHLHQAQGMLDSKKLEIARAEDDLRSVQSDVERHRKRYHELELAIRKSKRDNRMD